MRPSASNTRRTRHSRSVNACQTFATGAENSNVLSHFMPSLLDRSGFACALARIHSDRRSIRLAVPRSVLLQQLASSVRRYSSMNAARSASHREAHIAPSRSPTRSPRRRTPRGPAARLRRAANARRARRAFRARADPRIAFILLGSDHATFGDTTNERATERYSDDDEVARPLPRRPARRAPPARAPSGGSSRAGAAVRSPARPRPPTPAPRSASRIATRVGMAERLEGLRIVDREDGRAGADEHGILSRQQTAF